MFDETSGRSLFRHFGQARTLEGGREGYARAKVRNDRRADRGRADVRELSEGGEAKFVGKMKLPRRESSALHKIRPWREKPEGERRDRQRERKRRRKQAMADRLCRPPPPLVPPSSLVFPSDSFLNK